MLRPILRILKKYILFSLIIVFVLSFLFITIWKRNTKIDDDEELNIDLLKDKLIKLKRSHFLNKPIDPEDFETNSFEQHTQNHTLNHKRLFNNSLDLNNFTSENCRNTIQGKLLITDERGYTCKRYHLNSGGCCQLKHSPKRYSCETCNQLNCCEIIEFCISCCLEPNQKSLLQKVLSQQSALLSNQVNVNRGIQALFASVTDHFELCVAKCRTSSQSVQHENSYKNSKFKYCFGLYNGNEKIKNSD